MGEQNTLSRRAFVGCAATATAAIALGAADSIQAHAVTAAEKKAEAEAMMAKLNAMQSKLQEASASYEEAMGRREEAQAKMEDAQNRIDEASEQISDLQEQLGVRARNMYRSGSSSFIDMLLGATTFQAFTTNWDVLNDMNENDSQMVEQTKELRADVQQQKEVFEAEEKVAAEEEARAEQIVAETQGLVDEYESSYQQLSTEAAALLEAERKAAEEAERRRAEQERERERQNHRDGDNYPQTVGGTAVTRAYGEIGKPYVWGACGPGSFDCSGLVSFCLSGVYGKRLGTASSFTRWPRVGNPQPGDICCNSHHCGIYIGNNQMIHAPQAGENVKIGPVQSGMIYTRY